MSLNFTKEQFLNNNFKATVLYKKIPTDTLTAVASHMKLAKHFNNYNFLLESAENGNNKGRYSVIGINPDKIWKCSTNSSFINENFATSPQNFIEQNGNIINNFRKFVNDCKIDWQNLTYGLGQLPPVCAGVFGYMGYDMARLMENLPDRQLKDELKIADSIFIRPQILIVFDSLFDCALICAPLYQDSPDDYDSLCDKIQKTHKILQESLSENQLKNIEFEENFQSNFSEEKYCQAVEKSKEYIVAGDIFQILPSQRFQANFDKNLDPFFFYRSLRTVNPSPFLFFLKFDDFVLTGSSPEIMVSLKNKIVTIRPLAGTRKRGKSLDEDKKISQELLEDEKEIAEHLMLIDLGRHDVGSIAAPDSVKVSKKMIVEYYSHVMHLSSTVEGEIRDEFDAIDALIAGFPAGTVSGAPKIRAMEIIEEIENVRRSFYAGCVGYFASNSDMETCITLRSALIKDQKIYLQAGAGVVFDSVPKSEYQECINKSQALIKAYHEIKRFL
jgi:anthranilate synthase component 1